MAASAIPRVLVTGGSGYIALHIVRQLLEAGWRVRATVRDPTNEVKTEPLRSLPGASERLELVKADLLQPEEAWRPLVAGCEYVLHTASPFPLDVPKNRSDLIEPAVNGATSVLKACVADSGVKRVVLTSSCVSIAYGHPEGMGSKVWTPDDWSNCDDPSRIAAYCESKTRAERAAWDVVKSQPAGRGLELATINPSFVQGPTLSRSGCSSVGLIDQLLTGKIPGTPDLYMNTVDVSDVARAHIRAIVEPEAAGERFILGAKEFAFHEIAQVLRDNFGDRGYSPPTMRLSHWFTRLVACFDAGAAAFVPDLGQHFVVDNEKTTRVLGIKFRDPTASIVETAESGIRAGLIEDKTPSKEYSAGGSKAARVLPDIDVVGIRPEDIPTAAARAAVVAAAAASSA